MDSKKPLVQRQFGAMKDASDSQGGLLMVFVVLVFRAIFEFAIYGVAAFKTNISFRPVQCIPCLSALLFGSVLFKKSRNPRLFFKLNRYYHDGNPPLFSSFHFARTGSSIAESHG
jgi:hypothetical protein